MENRLSYTTAQRRPATCGRNNYSPISVLRIGVSKILEKQQLKKVANSVAIKISSREQFFCMTELQSAFSSGHSTGTACYQDH